MQRSEAQAAGEAPGASEHPSLISREIEDRARELGRALAEHPAVQRLKRARATVNEHAAARIMLRDLRQRERALLQKELSGQRPAPEEVEQWRRVAEIVGFNPYVRELLEAEAAMARLLAEVNAVVHAELGLPSVEEDEEATGQPHGPAPSSSAEAAREGAPGGSVPGVQSPAGPSPRLNVPRSRLWVPGQR